MDKERDRMENGSYLFRLNQELSGQAEINPYYAISNEAENTQDYDILQDSELAGSAEEGPVIQ